MMDRPTKLALTGAALAVALVSLGWVRSLTLEAELREAQAACEREAAATRVASGVFSGRLICEPDILTRDLYAVDYKKPPGVQGRLVDAQRAVWSESLGPYAFGGFTIFVLLAMPWLWYFLLRRLRELSDAIKGK